MVNLIDSPLAQAISTWIWEDDPLVSPEVCIQSLPFLHSDCLKRLLVKGIGIAIILAACLNKVPIMMNILRSRSTSGLSLIAIYGETIVYANGAAYGLLSGHPITAYGENASLFFQSMVLTAMMWYFSEPPRSKTERTIVSISAIVYMVVTTTMLQPDQYFILMTSIMPILLYSRGFQILETYRCKQTGAQSIITVSMSLVGCFIRILTTLNEVGFDIHMLGTLFMSAILSLTMFTQWIYYRSNTEKTIADIAIRAQKKES